MSPYSPYIITLLSEKTQSALREQTEYLGENANTATDQAAKERWQAMSDGAKTLLNIIESDPISQQGTTGYLNILDRRQLEFAISEAQRLLKQKSSIGKVRLYAVRVEPDFKTSTFTDRLQAEEAFVEAACRVAKEKHPEIKLWSELVPVEELGEYLGEEQAQAFLASNPEIVGASQ